MWGWGAINYLKVVDESARGEIYEGVHKGKDFGHAYKVQ
jgi:hypothetical protein